MFDNRWIVVEIMGDGSYAAFGPFKTQAEAEAYKREAYNPHNYARMVLLINEP